MRRITKKWKNSFTVPYPFLASLKKNKILFQNRKKFNYFLLKIIILGKISKIDGSKLNVQMIQHTF